MRFLCRLFSAALLLSLLTAGISFTAFAEVNAVTLSSHAFDAKISASGAYQVTDLENGWRFAGSLDGPASRLEMRHGVDALGTFQEGIFLYRNGERQGTIRLYDDRPLVEFRWKMLRAEKNQGGFPAFQSLPAGAYRLGFQPVPFGLYEFGKLGSQGPWVLFDGELNTVVLSPADHYFVADMKVNSEGASSGIVPAVQNLPAGFSHTTILVAGRGVNQALTTWGHTLREMGGSKAPPNTADILLRKLSYWTDHGAFYFYRYNPQLGYPGTLLAVKHRFAELGVPLGSMQLDSWFYPKGKTADWHKRKWTNAVGGEYLYRADKELFPHGLAVFQQSLGLPLITHARWIDRDSPYRKMYKMSGNVVIDPRFWQKTAAYLHSANVQVYEQDWMGRYAKAEQNLTDPLAFHDEMAHAMQRYGITMQYCMAAPADFMQGSHYSNLTTARTSHDRFQRGDWDSFLYDSRLTSSLGIWPWTDVFMSEEEGNLLVATLSAGPVGVGDAIEAIDAAGLLHAVRGDGVIVKPDETLRPLDRIFLADARRKVTPMVAVTDTSFGPLRVEYVFAYPREDATDATVQPSELGFHGEVYAYNWREGTGERLGAGSTLTIPFRSGWGYEVVSPIGPSGMALVGDTGNFVTAGRSRVPQVSDNGQLHIAVSFALNETAQTIAVYAPHAPSVEVSDGRKAAEKFDARDHLFLLTLNPGKDQLARVTLTLPRQPETSK